VPSGHSGCKTRQALLERKLSADALVRGRETIGCSRGETLQNRVKGEDHKDTAIQLLNRLKDIVGESRDVANVE
jgi:hypothetical protein